MGAQLLCKLVQVVCAAARSQAQYDEDPQYRCTHHEAQGHKQKPEQYQTCMMKLHLAIQQRKEITQLGNYCAKPARRQVHMSTTAYSSANMGTT